MANRTVTGASSPEYADKMALLFPEPGKRLRSACSSFTGSSILALKSCPREQSPRRSRQIARTITLP